MSTLFEYLPIGAFRTSPAGRFLRVNAALLRIMGCTTEAEMQAGCNDIAQDWYVEPARRQQFTRLLEHHGYLLDFVSEVYRQRPRERIWIRETAHVVRDEQGKLLYYEGTVEDITASQRAQLALAQSEERWKLALESSGDGVWDWYVQTGDEFYSRRCKEIYGFAEDEIPNRSEALDGHTHPDDLAQMQRDRDVHFKGETEIYRNEHRIFCKDGSWKWVLTRGLVISRDAQGLPVRMIGTHTDITQSKQEEKLQKALFEISEASHSSRDLLSLLQHIHEIVGKLMPAKNFYVALYDENSQELGFPYFVDEHDATPAPRKLNDTGLTEKVFRSGEALLLTPELRLPDANGAPSHGTQSVDWLGVPLQTQQRTIGVLAVQSYSGLVRYSEKDKALLQFVSSHVAMTLERTLVEQSLTQANRDLAGREVLLKQILDTASVAIFLVDMTGRITKANRRMAEMFCWSTQELEGKEYVELLDPSEQAIGRQKMLALLASQISFVDLDRYYRRADGAQFWGHLAGKRFYDVDGQELGLIGVIADITDRKRAQDSLQLAASVFTHAREGIMITDAAGTLIEVNNTFSLITGYSRDEALGQNPRVLQSGRQTPEFYATMWQDLTGKGNWYGEVWNRRKNGEVYAAMLTIGAVRDANGKTQNYVALFSDITPMKEHQSQLEHIAHYDTLTSLPNRVLLADRLQQAMLQSHRRGKSLAVAYLDLDGFKAVNDKHGHGHGDELLVALAERMKTALREGDTLARIGGDEFVAVLVDLEQPKDCDMVLERLLQAAADPVKVGENVLQVSASVGVTLYPLDGADADLLIRHADQAMYQAKHAGKNRCHLFDVAQDAAIQTRHESLEHIRKALDDKEFVLHYQPKVNMKTGQVIGAEALIRWLHPERGLLAPATFLPIVENHPISVELGEWVIATALAQMNAWRSASLDLPVSLNIGARQLQEAGFTQRLSAMLAAHPDVPPSCLQIEVLETNALDDIGQVSDVMRACQALGVRFALDDFGTGYSSLTYLKRLPVETLKIDLSFVRDMIHDPDNLAIVQGVVGLAAAFHREAIAEGVETAAHGNLLLSLGCELAQGYGIARPMPAEDLPAWVANWHLDPVWVD